MKLFFIQKIILLSSVWLLSACGTLLHGETQMIAIHTPEAEGARCVVQNQIGEQWIIERTPGTLTIPRRNPPLMLRCEKLGYHTILQPVEASISPQTALNVTNLGAGAVYDAYQRSLFAYPYQIDIWMEPKRWLSDKERDQWMEKKLLWQRKKEEEARQCRFSRFHNC
jgi:hypothetical protein